MIALGTSAVAAIAVLPAGVVQAPHHVPGWKTFASIAVLGTVCTAVAYLLFFTIISRAGAGYAALVTYLVPPVALAYGALFLDECVGVAALAGLVLILAAWRSGRAGQHRSGALPRRKQRRDDDRGADDRRGVARDRSADIARRRHATLRRNFTEPDDVPELGGARSYARRLRDYGGRDQVAWVVERLADPECRSAAITTFEPHTDTTYVPCISLLDFWRPAGPLELVVYAHSLDFGKKAYGNLVELARLQHEVAAAVVCGVGRLVIHTKSAHVYAPELELMASVTA